MRTEKPALLLYIVTGFLAVFATVFSYELLLLVIKPIIIPAIYFYYLSAKKGRGTVWVGLFFLLTFVGDTIVLMNFENPTKYIMGPYLLSYLILLKYAIADVRTLKFSLNGLGIAAFVFGLMLFITAMLVEFFSEAHQSLVIPVIVYSFVLSSYLALAGYYFYCKASNLAFNMAMAALFTAVSDIFYIMFSLIFHFPELNHFNFIAQVLSYFFITRYFILRKN